VLAVIGLGNPGYEYEGTRHNIGFAVVDALAEETGLLLSGGRGEYLIGRKMLAGENFLLVKPLTYMNNSGSAVIEIVDYFKIELSQLLVVLDDIQLPLGTLRIRLQGSSGGHNGLYSIIYHLSSEQFPRLRCGIGSPLAPRMKKQMADFVLSGFDRSEKGSVHQMILNARDAVLMAAREGTQSAIERYNGLKIQ